MKNINCNLCGNDKSELIYKSGDIRINTAENKEFYLCRCQKCGLAYLNPQPNWEELEPFYGYQTYGKSDNLVTNFATKLNKILNRKTKFLNFNQASGRFLNIGCDVCSYEENVMPSYPGWEFYGVEPGKAAAEIARQVKGLNFFEGKLNEAHYEDNFFDVILLNHVLEHLPNPSETLGICFRILKPGGHIIVSVPNFACPMRSFFKVYWLPLEIPRHLFHFTPETLKKMLLKNGFEVVSIKNEPSFDSFFMSLGNKMPGLKKIIKNNKILWPVFAVFIVVFPLIFFPILKISKWTNTAAIFRIVAIKKK